MQLKRNNQPTFFDLAIEQRGAANRVLETISKVVDFTEAEQRLAGCDLGKPQVEVVALRVVGFLHSARQAPHRAEPQPLAGVARAAEPYYADRHASLRNTVRSVVGGRAGTW